MYFDECRRLARDGDSITVNLLLVMDPGSIGSSTSTGSIITGSFSTGSINRADAQ